VSAERNLRLPSFTADSSLSGRWDRGVTAEAAASYWTSPRYRTGGTSAVSADRLIPQQLQRKAVAPSALAQSRMGLGCWVGCYVVCRGAGGPSGECDLLCQYICY